MLVGMSMPSLALQLQKQADSDASLTRHRGRTVEYDYVWTSDFDEDCESACHTLCASSACNQLARCDIDSEAKMIDLQLTHHENGICSSYTNASKEGPMVDANGVCTPHNDDEGEGCTFDCNEAPTDGIKLLCACEIALGTCSVAEDPHINVFDDVQVSLLDVPAVHTVDELVGDKWLVKSDRLKIQARFEDISEVKDGKVYMRAIALGGEILNHNIITVGSLEDPIKWNGENILDGQESSFYMRDGKFFVNATRGPSSLVQDPSQENPGVNIRLASGVSVVVNRQHHYINVAITMPQQHGGQEGLCGNFNGLASDDTLQMSNYRFNVHVSPDETLFKYF